MWGDPRKQCTGSVCERLGEDWSSHGSAPRPTAERKGDSGSGGTKERYWSHLPKKKLLQILQKNKYIKGRDEMNKERDTRKVTNKACKSKYLLTM